MSVVRAYYLFALSMCAIRVRDPCVLSVSVIHACYLCALCVCITHVLFMSLIHLYSQCVLSTCVIYVSYHVSYSCVLPLDQDLPSLCLRLLVCDFDRYQRHVVVGEVMTEMDKVEWPPEMELDFCQHLQPPIEVRDLA